MSYMRLFVCGILPFMFVQLMSLPSTGGPNYAKGWGEYGVFYAIALHTVLFTVLLFLFNWSVTAFVRRKR